MANLRADDWAVNGAGYNVSHAFGFGLMDAGEMVRRALTWTKVGGAAIEPVLVTIDR